MPGLGAGEGGLDCLLEHPPWPLHMCTCAHTYTHLMLAPSKLMYSRLTEEAWGQCEGLPILTGCQLSTQPQSGNIKWRLPDVHNSQVLSCAPLGAGKEILSHPTPGTKMPSLCVPPAHLVTWQPPRLPDRLSQRHRACVQVTSILLTIGPKAQN